MKENKGDKTKRLIVETAFKLFSKGEYTSVSLKNIELEAGLSRGAILYHFPTKDKILTAVIDKYLIESLSVSNANRESETFQYFFETYIKHLSDLQEYFLKFQIPNMAFALVNLNMQGFHFYEDFVEKTKKWNATEDQLWLEQLNKAIKRKEIRCGSEIEKIARLFKNLFYGTAYESFNNNTNNFIDVLEWQYIYLYNSIKG